MKKFLLLLHENIKVLENLPPKEMEKLINAHIAWATKLGEKGHFVSGDGLQDSATMISGKDCVIKDGPYVESKEMIGGYYLLQAKDLDAIIELAKDCPCHLWGGTTEIRPIADYEEC
ncbi:MAG: YciI family protein [Melioribacteraceae bacterium]